MKEYIEKEALLKKLHTGMGVIEMMQANVDMSVADVPGGWISVTERLPENDDHVLCCTRTKAGRQNLIIGYYMDGLWRCGMNSNVTHWMPLPEPPKEAE